ncbi:MAG: 30S ribosomal protein S16 [Candidatus Doudnabacteria bacterium]|nr:30S ribosomal protein S16 [Candidatus Doudnabacteria bacterium]
MLTIRLQRTGTKNRPTFRIVLAEKEKSASKKFQEVLGHYNPRSKEFGIKDDTRLKYWITQNVELSPTVRNLLVEKKLVEGKKVKAWAPKKKEGAEAQASPAPAPQATAQPVPTEAAPEAQVTPAAPEAEQPAA